MNTYLIDILRILEENTDESNRLSQQEILALMRKNIRALTEKRLNATWIR